MPTYNNKQFNPNWIPKAVKKTCPYQRQECLKLDNPLLDCPMHSVDFIHFKEEAMKMADCQYKGEKLTIVEYNEKIRYIKKPKEKKDGNTSVK